MSARSYVCWELSSSLSLPGSYLTSSSISADPPPPPPSPPHPPSTIRLLNSPSPPWCVIPGRDPASSMGPSPWHGRAVAPQRGQGRPEDLHLHEERQHHPFHHSIGGHRHLRPIRQGLPGHPDVRVWALDEPWPSGSIPLLHLIDVVWWSCVFTFI
jgi:hypothetical protein